MKLEIMQHLMDEGMAGFVREVKENGPLFVTHFSALDKDDFEVCAISLRLEGLNYRYNNNNQSKDKSKRYARIRRKIKRKNRGRPDS